MSVSINSVTDDKKLYGVIEQGIETKAETEYISVEIKIALSITLYDKYSRLTSANYCLMAASISGSQLKVDVFKTEEDARKGLAALMDAMELKPSLFLTVSINLLGHFQFVYYSPP